MDQMRRSWRDLAPGEVGIESVDHAGGELLQRDLSERRLDVDVENLRVSFQRLLSDPPLLAARRTGCEPFLDPLPKRFLDGSTWVPSSTAFWSRRISFRASVKVP
jgi:hypothetical protein